MENQQDSLLFKAIAEVMVAGYIDNYGNRVQPVQEAMRSWKPNDEFLKRVEAQISPEIIATKLVEYLSKISVYDKTKFTEEIMKRAKEIAATKIAEQMILEMKKD